MDIHVPDPERSEPCVKIVLPAARSSLKNFGREMRAKGLDALIGLTPENASCYTRSDVLLPLQFPDGRSDDDNHPQI